MLRRKITGPAYLVVDAKTSSTHKRGLRSFSNAMVVLATPAVERFDNGFDVDHGRSYWYGHYTAVAIAFCTLDLLWHLSRVRMSGGKCPDTQ